MRQRWGNPGCVAADDCGVTCVLVVAAVAGLSPTWYPASMSLSRGVWGVCTVATANPWVCSGRAWACRAGCLFRVCCQRVRAHPATDHDHDHVDFPPDVSADLTELGRTPIAVVCAGVKSILDIGLTLEVLETNVGGGGGEGCASSDQTDAPLLCVGDRACLWWCRVCRSLATTPTSSLRFGHPQADSLCRLGVTRPRK